MANTSSYVNLLNSQIPIDLESAEHIWFDSQVPDESGDKVRRKWSPLEDKILIGAWLNTSKDPVISNEQKADAFWNRILDYYNASPHLVGTEPRKLRPCKQRWARINEQVSKFAGCYDAALRDVKSGTSDDDLMQNALDLFFKKNKYKFSLDHCWRELRHDQKWCASFQAKDSGKDKRKEVDGEDSDVREPESRPIGVKAAKGQSKKKKSVREEELTKLQSVLETKEKLSRNKILERLMAKTEPLCEMENTLKLKLMSELL